MRLPDDPNRTKEVQSAEREALFKAITDRQMADLEEISAMIPGNPPLPQRELVDEYLDDIDPDLYEFFDRYPAVTAELLADLHPSQEAFPSDDDEISTLSLVMSTIGHIDDEGEQEYELGIVDQHDFYTEHSIRPIRMEAIALHMVNIKAIPLIKKALIKELARQYQCENILIPEWLMVGEQRVIVEKVVQKLATVDYDYIDQGVAQRLQKMGSTLTADDLKKASESNPDNLVCRELLQLAEDEKFGDIDLLAILVFGNMERITQAE